jgi:hypothetical protein
MADAMCVCAHHQEEKEIFWGAVWLRPPTILDVPFRAGACTLDLMWRVPYSGGSIHLQQPPPMCTGHKTHLLVQVISATLQLLQVLLLHLGSLLRIRQLSIRGINLTRHCSLLRPTAAAAAEADQKGRYAHHT